MPQGMSRERIAGIVAVTIALLAVAAPILAPPPDFGFLKKLGITGGREALPIDVGLGVPQVSSIPVTYNGSFSGPAALEIDAQSSIVLLQEGGREINVVVRGGHDYSVSESGGKIKVSASSVVVVVTAPRGSLDSVSLKLMSSLVNGSVSAPLQLRAVSTKFSITLIAGDGSSDLRLSSSAGTLVVVHEPGSGVKLSVSAARSVVVVEGEYSRQIVDGHAEIGEGPYTVSIDADNSYLAVRVTGR